MFTCPHAGAYTLRIQTGRPSCRAASPGAPCWDGASEVRVGGAGRGQGAAGIGFPAVRRARSRVQGPGSGSLRTRASHSVAGRPGLRCSCLAQVPPLGATPTNPREGAPRPWGSGSPTGRSPPNPQLPPRWLVATVIAGLVLHWMPAAVTRGWMLYVVGRGHGGCGGTSVGDQVAGPRVSESSGRAGRPAGGGGTARSLPPPPAVCGGCMCRDIHTSTYRLIHANAYTRAAFVSGSCGAGGSPGSRFPELRGPARFLLRVAASRSGRDGAGA